MAPEEQSLFRFALNSTMIELEATRFREAVYAGEMPCAASFGPAAPTHKHTLNHTRAHNEPYN